MPEGIAHHISRGSAHKPVPAISRWIRSKHRQLQHAAYRSVMTTMCVVSRRTAGTTGKLPPAAQICPGITTTPESICSPLQLRSTIWRAATGVPAWDASHNVIPCYSSILIIADFSADEALPIDFLTLPVWYSRHYRRCRLPRHYKKDICIILSFWRWFSEHRRIAVRHCHYVVVFIIRR